MFDKFSDFLLETAQAFFVPTVCCFYALTSSVFLNVSYEEATGLERAGNTLLAPAQYLLGGQVAKKDLNGNWTFSNRFQYEENFIVNTTVCSVVVLPAAALGVSLKALSLLLDNESVMHQKNMQTALYSPPIISKKELYRSYGIDLNEGKQREWLTSENRQRRPGDENALRLEKEALKDICQLLEKADIIWWVDCGTCLGAYRYGGIIPWDLDVDVAVLMPDFRNVLSTLGQLDPQKYIVQDWSSRNQLESYIKVYIRQTGTLIDIYHYKILPEQKQIQYILSFEENIFCPESWKIRERRFTVPADFGTVFPLKKALFDGIELYVPNKTEVYLQRYYGENLAPAKIFDPNTGQYEKDLNHPYWQRAHAH